MLGPTLPIVERSRSRLTDIASCVRAIAGNTMKQTTAIALRVAISSRLLLWELPKRSPDRNLIVNLHFCTRIETGILAVHFRNLIISRIGVHAGRTEGFGVVNSARGCLEHNNIFVGSLRVQ